MWYVISKERRLRMQDNGALAVYRPNTGEADMRNASGHFAAFSSISNAGSKAASLRWLWQSGIFRFHNDEELEAFSFARWWKCLPGSGRGRAEGTDRLWLREREMRTKPDRIYLLAHTAKRSMYLKRCGMFCYPGTMLARLSDDGSNAAVRAANGYETQAP